ncbi:MAG: glycosyltransferase, partial [Thermoleophilaceae bacterium]|nr:glycosyltransferase [Thermoleophilaceae bacterium]
MSAPTRRFLLCAFGDPGHAFPAIALGRALAARGHEVCLQTWERWREDVEREGMRFEPAPEYRVFPKHGESLKPYQAAVLAAEESRPLIRDFDPRAIVADILTTAASLGAELEGRRW